MAGRGDTEGLASYLHRTHPRVRRTLTPHPIPSTERESAMSTVKYAIRRSDGTSTGYEIVIDTKVIAGFADDPYVNVLIVNNESKGDEPYIIGHLAMDLYAGMAHVLAYDSDTLRERYRQMRIRDITDAS
jgi:hypothetical protein